MSQRDLALIQFLAMWEQGIPVVWCETDDQDTYAGVCAYYKAMDPNYGRWGPPPVYRSSYAEGYPRAVPLDSHRKKFPKYICYGHCQQAEEIKMGSDDQYYKLTEHYDAYDPPIQFPQHNCPHDLPHLPDQQAAHDQDPTRPGRACSEPVEPEAELQRQGSAEEIPGA